MKRAIIFSIIIIFIFGCKTYVQVFDTNSTNAIIENDFYVYENDTIKITYAFWHEQGLMTLGIYNKLKIPLYIDWKKSSYIVLL